MFYLWDPPKNISPSCQNIFYHFRPPSIFINLFRSPSQYFFHYTKYLFSFFRFPSNILWRYFSLFGSSLQHFCEDNFHFLDPLQNILPTYFSLFGSPSSDSWLKQGKAHTILDKVVSFVINGTHNRFNHQAFTNIWIKLQNVFVSNCKMYLSLIAKCICL